MKLLIKIISYSIIFTLLQSCSYKALLQLVKPPRSFSEKAAPIAPDYSENRAWHLIDIADNKKKADVFFVHPTTYIKGKKWNQDLNDSIVNFRTRVLSLQFQAAIFYQDYRVFAPKYRQAIVYSFVDKKDNGKQALELAYQDVKKAFLYYWQHHNKGRPFILASHSQGTYHSLRLLKELQNDSLFRSKLIVAYMVGWPIKATFFAKNTQLSACTTATQVGCLASWNTEGYEPKMSLAREVYPQDSIYCINPLSWQTNEKYVSKNLNLGSLQQNKIEKKTEIILYYCDAKVINGVVKISKPANQKELQMPMGKDNYHLYDYTFFYENIRQNAKVRTGSYFKSKQKR